MSPPTVAIVGLGLMGGSLAHDLAARGFTILGHDDDNRTLAAALESGIVREPLGDDLQRVLDADWLVLAVPVDAAAEVLERARAYTAHLHLITDLGSTKRTIAAAAARLGLERRFVGSHPLAGDHRSGWQAARRGMFAGRRVLLCAGATTEPGALRAVRALWHICGARTEQMTAAEHDHLLAWTSHLPQILSSALGGVLGDAGIAPARLGPGGRDMTRLAGSSARMWTGIALQNADALEPALARVQDEIEDLRALLEAGDRCGVLSFFSRAAEWSTPSSAQVGTP